MLLCLVSTACFMCHRTAVVPLLLNFNLLKTLNSNFILYSSITIRYSGLIVLILNQLIVATTSLVVVVVVVVIVVAVLLHLSFPVDASSQFAILKSAYEIRMS